MVVADPECRVGGAGGQGSISRDCPTLLCLPDCPARSDVCSPVPITPSLSAAAAWRHSLPAQPTSIVGREIPLDLALRQLERDEVRLLTFVGPAGVGKTRLAVAVADAAAGMFTDGVFFVDLAQAEQPSEVTPVIAEALGVREVQDHAVAGRLQRALHGQRALLVLDNFEQVLPAAGQVAALLAACPRLKVLATSRAALRLRWEYVLPVQPLPLPTPSDEGDVLAEVRSPAVELFVQRAQAADPTFALTPANAPTVAEVCTRLDGLPLAIELAAARSGLLDPRTMLKQMRRRLDLLVGGAVDLPARHQTLRQAFAYSYDLLSADEQAFFRRLAVFAAGCTAEAAAAVAGSEVTAPGEEADEDVALMSTFERLASLVHKSLLYQEQSGNADLRFLMLETTREYAFEQLATRGDLADAQRRLADHCVGLARQARGALVGPDQGRWLDQVEREHDNLRGALRWCVEVGDAERGLALAAALWRFWCMRGYFAEGRIWFDRLLALPESSRLPTLRAEALNAAGNLAYYQGDYAAAQAFGDEALALQRALNDEGGVAAGLDTLGMLAFRRGDQPQALKLLEESLAVRRRLGDDWGAANTLHNLGDVELAQENPAAARARYQLSLLQWQALGDQWSVALALESLAMLAHARGRNERALRLIGAAAGVRERLYTTCCAPVTRAGFQRTLESARAALSLQAADAAWAQGKATSLDEAVSLACAPEEHAVEPVHVGPLAWLTRREREVAALLLRGCSNRQIAEELVITERTAETHVCRILGKLGLDSRAQVAAWVMDRSTVKLAAS